MQKGRGGGGENKKHFPRIFKPLTDVIQVTSQVNSHRFLSNVSPHQSVIIRAKKKGKTKRKTAKKKR